MNNKQWNNRIILSVIIILSLFSSFYPSAESITEAMLSSNYEIPYSSLNVGGNPQDSTTYKMQDTIGEIATGLMTGTSYKLEAGFQALTLPPVLIFSITDNTADLGLITTLAAKTDSTGFTVATNTLDGYVVTVSGNTLTSNSSSANIDALATPNTSSPGTEQFGINLVDNSSPDVGANPSGGSGQAASDYDTINNFKFVSGNTIANSSTFSSITTFTISYLGNISTSTVAGDYSDILTLIATGTF